jgi:hypothetical protein
MVEVTIDDGATVEGLAMPIGLIARGFPDGTIAVWDGTAHCCIDANEMSLREIQRAVNIAIIQLREAAKERARG